jgi:predicted transcriptional regulator
MRRDAMTKETISFRIDRDKKTALDGVAAEIDRDRSYVINEAVDAYLEVRRWQLGHIREGLRQAEAGEFATEDEVRQAFARWRR